MLKCQLNLFKITILRKNVCTVYIYVPWTASAERYLYEKLKKISAFESFSFRWCTSKNIRQHDLSKTVFHVFSGFFRDLCGCRLWLDGAFRACMLNRGAVELLFVVSIHSKMTKKLGVNQPNMTAEQRESCFSESSQWVMQRGTTLPALSPYLSLSLFLSLFFHRSLSLSLLYLSFAFSCVGSK